MSFNPGRGTAASQVLTWDGTKATWAAGGGGDTFASITTITTTYTALTTDYYIRCNHSAGFVLTLPNAPATGKSYLIKDVSSAGASTNNITIQPSGGGTIDGQSSFSIMTDRGAVSFVHTGSNVWDVF